MAGGTALNRRMKQAAEMIRAQAARNAAPFSRRIPVSMNVESDGAGDVHIELHKEIAPNGYPFEYGVWHPLNRPKDDPDKYWYEQPYRPFLEAAIYQKLDPAVDIVADVVDDWTAILGWSPGDY
jgi:hypothetical protein